MKPDEQMPEADWKSPYATAENLLAPLLFLTVALALQLWQPVPWDADTAYHFVVGKLISEHGFLKSFPWTPFSILSDTYADKELLFHLLFALLARLDWITASRAVGTLGGFAILTALWLWLKAEKVPRAWLWTLLPLAFSSSFAFRFALVRPHLFSIALALSITFLAWRRRILPLFALCLLYPLCYVGFPLALLIVGVVEAARLAGGGRVEWKTLVAALAGLSGGLLIHPNFPNILKIVWIQNVTILMDTAWASLPGFALGDEFQPMNFITFLRGGSLPALLLTMFALASALRRRREEGLTLAFAVAALIFFALTLQTSRFIEYFIPFAVAAAALASRRLKSGLIAPVLVVASLVYLLSAGLAPLAALHHRLHDTPPAMEEAVRSIVPEGAQVFTTGAILTGEMMLALPDRRFMVALDPVFFYVKNPSLYRQWFDLVHSPPQMPVGQIKSLFGAEWILCERRLPEYYPFLDAVNLDPGASIAYIDDLWVLFKVN